MKVVEIENGKEIKSHGGNMTPRLAKMRLVKMQKWFPGKLFEIRRDGGADMGPSSQPSGSHPTAMYSGDPGVRSSVQAEMSGRGQDQTWELSEEEKFDIAEDGG